MRLQDSMTLPRLLQHVQSPKLTNVLMMSGKIEGVSDTNTVIILKKTIR